MKAHQRTSLDADIAALRRRLRRLDEPTRRRAIKKLVDGFGGFFGLGPHHNNRQPPHAGRPKGKSEEVAAP